MKAKKVRMKQKRLAAPKWIFPWRARRQPLMPKILAVVITGAFFVGFFSLARIQIATPVAWGVRKAAVIQVLDDADGRSLSRLARESGPYPSRFEPSEWLATDSAKNLLAQATKQSASYVPALREIAEPLAIRPMQLATPGKPVLPDRRKPARSARATEKPVLVPALYPLSGIAMDGLPRDLPPFDHPVDAAMTAEPWRFLLRLNAAGSVLESVSLSGAEAAGAAALNSWLRSVSFPPETNMPDRWITVGLGFSNKAADGTESR